LHLSFRLHQQTKKRAVLSIFWLLLASAGLMTALVRLVAWRERWTAWGWVIAFLGSVLAIGALWLLAEGAPG
jgi:hypothetical protein